MEFDEIFQYIGSVGTYQLVIYFMLGSIEVTAPDAIGMNFMAAAQDHWCNVGALQNFSFVQQKYLAIPDEGLLDNGNRDYASCYRFPIDFSNYTIRDLLLWNRTEMTGNYTSDDWVKCDNGWVYDQTDFLYTINSEWDLVCDRDWMTEMVSTIYMAGRLVGAITCGLVSDKYGRKNMLIIYHSIKTVGAIICFVNNYVPFVIGRFMMAVGSTGSSLAGYIIVTEIVGGSNYRALFGVAWGALWSIGYMVNAGVAYFIRDYLKIQLFQTVPCAVFFLFIAFADESPRWLVSQGRNEEAMKIIKKIARINRKKIPEEVTFDVAGKESHKKGTFRDLFRTPNIRKKTLLSWLAWFTDSLVYFGLSLNAGTLAGSIFLNTFLQGLIELPARFTSYAMMERIGRRLTTATALLGAGLFNFLCIPFILNRNLTVGRTVMGMLGKFCIQAAFASSYTYTLELFPTGIRNNAMGSSSMLARVSGMAAPYMGKPMERVWMPLPSIIFGIFGTASGASIFALPETLGYKLPETLEEAESHGLGKKVLPASDEKMQAKDTEKETWEGST